MEGDVPEETVAMRSDLGVVLGTLSLFSGLDVDVLGAIAREVEWLSLPGGAMLFDVGEQSDAMYIVLSGCLAVFAGADRKQSLGRVLAGDTVGEMGLISGRPRSATVVALRDSELARLSRDAFDRVFRRHPEAMLRIAQLTVDRLESAQARGRARPRGARTFTIIPQSIDLDAAGFASEFVKALAPYGRAELVWSVRGATHTSHWFHRIESANDFVVYIADPTATPWSSLCVRQADALVLLARADSEPGPWATLTGLRNSNTSAQRSELVLLHDEAITPGAAARWLDALPGLIQVKESLINIPHHHVRGPEDIARVARLLTGHANGIVLSGGGARGFAHIGIVQAFREAGIVIDLVGGTSLGGIMGAAVANGWSIEDMTARFRRAFVDVNPIGDYTIPLISLTSGRRVSRLLHAGFGDVAIEDLPLPFYCVSSNLTTGHSEIHRRGTLWRWLRASVSIPGVLPPVMNHGDVLVDGATMNNLPVDIMRELGRGPVIGCDVGADKAFTSEGDEMDMPPLWRIREWLLWRQKRPNILRILLRAGMVNSSATTLAHRDKTDLLLQPPLARIDMLNWKAFDRAIAAGYEYTVQRLAALPQDSPLLRGIVKAP
jgi:NTE family protein